MSSAKNSEQIRLERRTSFYWRVTFDHPPLNIGSSLFQVGELASTSPAMR